MIRQLKDRKHSQIKIILLPIVICIIAISCKKEEIEIFHDLIADGCIPSTVILDEPLLGGSEDNYTYENGRLIRFGNYIYEYENGLVSRIQLGPNRYEDYLYNDELQVIQSIQFRKDNPSEDFKIVDDKEYEYDGNLVERVKDNDDNLTHEISYYPNSNNIDSIKTLNSDFELIELTVFQYDQFNNVHRNLLMPKFGFYWWLDKTSENNVKQRKIIKLENQNDTSIYNYDFQYNEYDYPVEINLSKVNSSFTTKTTITYINCE